MEILKVENISKRFGSLTALDEVNFSIERGSICGLLGPNGAGKTTLLRIINSILAADTGKVWIEGSPASLKTSESIGYMPEERGLYDKMRVENQILYFGALKGKDEGRLREVMKDYLKLFGLDGHEHRRIKDLSKGNQQKVQIIATLVHEPSLVIFDEPFSGFDPINGQILQEVISRLHSHGTTIILSSHNMAAIEEICSDIVLIDKGKLLVNDSIENIKERYKDNTLLFTTAEKLSLSSLQESGIVECIVSVKSLRQRKGFAYELKKRDNISNREILNLISGQSEILQFEEALPSLTDIFIRYTKK